MRIIHLPLALLRRSSNLPGHSNGHGRVHCVPIWSCSAGGLPCRRHSRATRCALTAPFHPYLVPPRLRSASRSAVCFLLHFPSRFHAWPLASLLPVGVRTFLDPVPRLRSGFATAILRFAPRKEHNKAAGN